MLLFALCLTLDAHVIRGDERFYEKLLHFINEKETLGLIEELNCEIAHETYQNQSNTSYHANYEQFAVAVDNEYCGPVGK